MFRLLVALGLACLATPMRAQDAMAPPAFSEACQPDESTPEGDITGFVDETGLPCLPFAGAYPIEQSFPLADGPLAHTVAATGRLDVFTDAGLVTCTALVVAQRQIATDAACMPGVLENETIGATEILNIRLHLDFYYPAQPLWMVDTHNLSRAPAFTDGRLTLLELVPDALPFPDWRRAPLAKDSPARYAPLVLFGHPIGSPLVMSQPGCLTDAQPVEARPEHSFGHTCATLSGITGAPLFDLEQGGVVGLHSAQDPKTLLRTAHSVAPLREQLGLD